MAYTESAGIRSLNMMNHSDYIIRIVQKASDLLNLNIFITPKDYDIIYRWWEKEIPVSLVIESMKIVDERWKKKAKQISSYSSFNYEVKKNHKSSIELKTGTHASSPEEMKPVSTDPIETFFSSFPADLEFCRPQFEFVRIDIQEQRKPDIEALNQALMDKFCSDENFTLVCENFLQGLAPELRTEKIRNRYLLNSIYSRYRIPEFSLL